MPDPLGSLAFTWPFFAVFVIAYAIGSTPFGVILVRLSGRGDIRKIGSGNIGATNVLRSGSGVLAAATLVLDGAKGAAPVILANAYLTQDFAVVAGAGALLGHLLPLWLKLGSLRDMAFAVAVLAYLVVVVGLLLVGKGVVTPIAILLFAASPLIAWGGKGVATGLGVLLALEPAVGALACLTWIAVAAVLRYSSLAALAAFLGAPVFAFILSNAAIADRYLSDPQRVEFAVFVAIAIYLRHLGNIRRLLRGDEPRIGATKGAAAGTPSER
jgi:glycerol-3-phosphate acyltransferase PlsY